MSWLSQGMIFQPQNSWIKSDEPFETEKYNSIIVGIITSI